MQLRWNELLHFNQADSEPLSVTRYAGEIYMGGRIGGADADNEAWIYDRAGEHEDAELNGQAYEGFWAFNTPPIRTTAKNLSIEGATYQGEIPGSEVAYVEAGTPLKALWGLAFREYVANHPGWEIHLFNAATGANLVNISNFTTTFSDGTDSLSRTSEPVYSCSLDGLTSGDYLLWVRVSSGIQPYQLPPDYLTVTGKSVVPYQYQWVHSVSGVTYAYDPIYNVGARPYQANHPLLLKRAEALTNGSAIKNPEWVNYLITFDADGNQTTQGGEWAALRIHAGDGEWLGDENCSANPQPNPGAALWTVAGGVATPVMLNPTLRSVGELRIIDDVLWVGGMVAGRSGRTVALIATNGTTVSRTALGTLSVAQFWCECSLGDESVHSIRRYPDTAGSPIYALSFCEEFKLEADNTITSRHPGGRSLVVAKKPAGSQRMAFATESDFAGSSLYDRAFNYVLSLQDGQYTVGPPTTHHYDSILAEFSGNIWGISQKDNRQHLGSLDASGKQWQPIAEWPNTLYDMGRVSRCGPRLLAFGTSEGYQPTAMAFDGSTLKYGLSLPYHIRRAEPVLSSDGKRENCLAIARKIDEEGVVEDGFYIIETTGEPARLVFPCTSEDEDGDCSEWCLPIEIFTELGINPDELPDCLNWSGTCWVSGECGGDLWLEKVVTEDSVCYVLHGTLPYDSTLWDGLEWEEGRECVNPVPTCEDASCVLGNMPEGTTVHILRLETTGTISAIFTADPEGDGAEISRYWPWLWARVDGTAPFPEKPGEALDEADLAILAEFNQPVRYLRDTWLNLPASSSVEVAFLIPPGYSIAPILLARW